jgi:hypothetical protein
MRKLVCAGVAAGFVLATSAVGVAQGIEGLEIDESALQQLDPSALDNIDQEQLNKALSEASKGDPSSPDSMLKPLRAMFERATKKALDDNDYDAHERACDKYLDALGQLEKSAKDNAEIREEMVDVHILKARYYARDYPEAKRSVEKAKASLAAAESKLEGLSTYLKGTLGDRISDARRELFDEGGGPAIDTERTAPAIDTGADDGGPKEIILN